MATLPRYVMDDYFRFSNFPNGSSSKLEDEGKTAARCTQML